MNNENEADNLVKKAMRKRTLNQERDQLGTASVQRSLERQARERGTPGGGRGERGSAVPIAVPAADRPLFERKMAEEVLEKTSARSIEPTGERESGTVEVRGGPLVPVQRPHKNWEHAIAHNFELRARLGTIKYTDMVDLPGNLTLDIGGFGYHSVRARPVPFVPASVIIDMEAPTGVPTAQIQPSHPSLPEAPIARRRQWECFLEIYYPQNTMVQFSPLFSTETIVRQVAEYWEPADLEAIIGSGNPVAGAVLVKDVVGQTLTDYLAIEGGRPANTSDLFYISYSERTGKAVVMLLAEGMVGHDPEVPPPVEPSEPPYVPPAPWAPPTSGGGGDTPAPIAPELEYIDPLTGLPLVVEPAPPIESSLYVLHARAISWSDDGGSTWRARPAPGTDDLTDICAGPGGIYVLSSSNEVWFARYPEVPFVKIDMDNLKGEDRGIEVPNGDFETGELAPWVNMTSDPAQVKKTSYPPQVEGSKWYLTRQWNVYNPQPYRVRQTIDVPEDVPTAGLVASVDCYVDGAGQAGRLRLLLEEEIAVTQDTFTIVRTGSNFRADGFATSPTEGPLNLVGTGAPTTGAFISESLPVWLRGNNSQFVSARIDWRVERTDGSIYNGLIALRIFDLDAPERLTIDGIEDYNLLASDVTATVLGPKEVRFDGGASDGVTSDVPIARIHVVVGAEFSFTMTGITQSAIGLKGQGAGTPTSITLSEAEVVHTTPGAWTNIEVPLALNGQPRVIVELSAFATDPDAAVDVFFDNVRLNAKNVPVAQVPTAIGYDAGQDGGADVYVGSELVERRGVSGDMATAPTPDDGITIADSRDAVKVASNGAQAWVRDGGDWTGPYDGPFTSVVADPLVALMRDNGMILTSVGGAFAPAPFTAGATIVGDRYRGGLLLTAPVGNVEHLDASGISSEPSVQPVNAEAANRRSMAMDAGRLIGWNIGTRDIFWKDQSGGWKLGNATVDGIKKIVEFR